MTEWLIAFAILTTIVLMVIAGLWLGIKIKLAESAENFDPSLLSYSDQIMEGTVYQDAGSALDNVENSGSIMDKISNLIGMGKPRVAGTVVPAGTTKNTGGAGIESDAQNRLNIAASAATGSSISIPKAWLFEDLLPPAATVPAQPSAPPQVTPAVESMIASQGSRNKRMGDGVFTAPVHMIPLDGALGNPDFYSIQVTVANLSPGQEVDLYKNTNNVIFKEGRRGVVYTVGPYVFMVASNRSWRYMGLRAYDECPCPKCNIGQRWLLRLNSTIGSAKQSPLNTCPFPSDDCALIASQFVGPEKNIAYLGNGRTYMYDGLRVQRV